MLRTRTLSVGFVVLGLLAAGCDSAKNAATRVEEGAKKEASRATDLAKRAKDDVKEAADKARPAGIKAVEDQRSKFEENVKYCCQDRSSHAEPKFDVWK